MTCNVRITYQCCSVKTISITYSECVFVVLGIEYAMRMRYIVICGLPVSKICFHIISKWHDCRKKLLNLNLYFDFLYNFCPKYFSF
jgi:hypothetical protein